MDYKSYQHIERFGTSETDGILEGEVFLYYKIDGTNACIWLKDDGTLGFGSRKRELSLDKDNAGFMNALIKESDRYLSYLKKHPTHIIYGEWLVPNVLKTYKKEAWKHFYVFDVYDTTREQYLDPMEYIHEFQFLGIGTIPTIAILTNPTIEQVKGLLDRTGDFLIEKDLGEGIVIKNYEYRNKYGRQTWAKILTEDFSSKKKDGRIKNKEFKVDGKVENEIVNKYLTPEFVQKEQAKIVEIRGEWSSKYIAELLGKVFHEFWRDNWESIFKKYHYPTIDFRLLKSCCDNYVKDVVMI